VEALSHLYDGHNPLHSLSRLQGRRRRAKVRHRSQKEFFTRVEREKERKSWGRRMGLVQPEAPLLSWDGYQCGTCGAEFKTQAELRSHQMSQHSTPSTNTQDTAIGWGELRAGACDSWSGKTLTCHSSTSLNLFSGQKKGGCEPLKIFDEKKVCASNHCHRRNLVTNMFNCAGSKVIISIQSH